jgi:methylene-fatty-acyl-phospholipid synthase
VGLWIFLGAAALLSLERISYLWIWRNPDSFRRLCARARPFSAKDPVNALEYLFYGFKVLQCAVFLGWCMFQAGGWLFPLAGSGLSIALGAAMIVAGQLLNLSVFYRLGKIGVFYGNRFGYKVAWCRRFPFSMFDHPQYFGALLSIWGFFLVMRFPHDDWFFLPVLETVYYILAAYFER